MQVLVFEPHRESAEHICTIVGKVGLACRTVKTLAEFVAALQGDKPRLVIAEAVIPGYDDFAALRYIAEDSRLQSVPVIVIAGRTNRDNVVTARRLGARGFIVKPFDKKALVQQLKLALNIRDLNPGSSGDVRGPVTGGARHRPRKISLTAINSERAKNQILQKIETIPSLPSIVYKVMELINRETSNAADFENLIIKDQALTARMLKMVNSSFYSLTRKVNSISDAVVYLGHNTIRSLVLGASTSNLFKKSMPIYGFRQEGLWQHANIVAAFSRQLATAAGLSAQEVDNCFISGLLHDIGKLILGPFVEQHGDQINPLLESGHTLSQAEEAVLGFSHGHIGGILLTNWKLPKNMVEVVTYHHEPAASETSAQEAHVVAAANLICNQQAHALERQLHDPEVLRRELETSLGALGIAADWHEQKREELLTLADNVVTLIRNIG
ncbi:MAG: response regulator [Deltaproteobacteria bacterium]|nr:response regulator [Candidatus Anaeroferrophillacea bacterium]